MTRSVSFLLVALVLVIIPSRTQAGDMFTGFQIDNKSQYFGYLGVRTPVLLMSGGTTLFAQAMTAGLGYSFKSNGQVLDTNVQFVVPSLGISQSFGRWTFLALAGPQLRRIEEDRLNTSSSVDHQVGFFGQVEGLYWHKKGSLHAIGSYADLDNFFWGRLRGKLLIYKSNQGCCPLYTGWDIAGMGNGDYRAIQTGPILEILIGKVFFLVRGGYQNSTSFHNGGYGGAEIYFPF